MLYLGRRGESWQGILTEHKPRAQASCLGFASHPARWQEVQEPSTNNSGTYKGSAARKGYSGSIERGECYKVCVYVQNTDSCGL